jgi:imidazolonepropionase-like amidohydrolase
LIQPDVLRDITSEAHRLGMGLDRDSGTIAPGKRADLILVRGNPLNDFSALRIVIRVVTAGRMYDPAPLWGSVGFRP